jgi:hypothetical protein
MRRQMRPPTAHQVEDRAALREDLRVNLADLRDRTVIDMRDESRDRVKYLIIVVIDASEEIGGKLSGHPEILFWQPVDRLNLSLNISHLSKSNENFQSLVDTVRARRLK